jgi:ferredoxin
VGIASKARLLDSPPSADPTYLMPAAQSIISFAVKMDKKTARDFLSKQDWLSHCEERKQLAKKVYAIGDKLVEYLQSLGYQALNVDPNCNFRPEPGAADVTEMTEFIPVFSHRYGAVAAGLGRLGWSGNLLTPQYNAMVELGTVITSAELQPDPLLETNPCDRCKLCTAVCPVEMIGKKEAITIRVAGIEEEIAAKQPNTCCWIGCTGYHGLAPNGRWSNWSPYRVDTPLPTEKAELDVLNTRLQKADPLMSLDDNSFSDYRATMLDPDWFANTVCGNCRMVCWKDPEDRKQNRRLLAESGVVVLAPDGMHKVADGEIIELETPYVVKVAMLKEDHQKAQAAGKPTETYARAPLDIEVLKHIYSKQ